MYYTDDGHKTTKRFEALQDASKYHYYFHDETFSAYPWLIEPTSSLPTLYRQRAQQIRDQYEHVILACSGGRDSTQVLEAFHYNNIKIDEVIVVGALSQDPMPGSDANHNGDLYHNILPTLVKLGITPRILDYSSAFANPYEFTLIKKYGPDYFKEINTAYYSPHNLFWHDLRKYVGQGNNKRTAVVYGHDKPNFEHDEATDRCYTFFHDISGSDYGGFQEDENFKRIHFFTAPDSIDIIAKQLHLVRKFFREQVGRTMSREKFYYHRWDIVVGLIYNLKNPLVHHSWKSRTGVISLRDAFLLDKKDTDIYRLLMDTTKRISTEIPIGQTPIPRFHTKNYYLE